MGGFSNDGDDSVVFADNVDFSGAFPVTKKVTTNGQLLIGSTTAPNIRVGTLTSSGGTVAITSGSGSINLEAVVPVATTYNENSGSATPADNILNVIGQNAGTSVQVMMTTGDSNNVRIENRTWQTQYVVDSSVTVGLRGTFSTIQSAINQAVTDGASLTNRKTIFIRPNSYIENLTIPSGINLLGYVFQNDPNLVTERPRIIGNHTFSGVVLFGCKGVYFQNIDATNPTFTNDTFSIVEIEDCIFNTASTGVTFTIDQGNFRQCNFLQTSYQAAITMTGNAYLRMDNCLLGSGRINNSGAAYFWNCEMVGPVVNDNGQVFAYNTTFFANDTANISGTGTGGEIIDCIFSSSDSTTTAVTGGSQYYMRDCSKRGGSIGPSNLYTSTTGLPACLGGNIYRGRRVAEDTTIDDLDYYLGVTSTAAARTITLPSSGVPLDRVYIIKDESGGAGTNNITVQVAGGLKTIDGAASKAINTNYGFITVIYDGTNYFII